MAKAIKTKIKVVKPGPITIDSISLEKVIVGYEDYLERLMTDNEKKKLFYAGVASIIDILEDVYFKCNGEKEYEYTFEKQNVINAISSGLRKANEMMNRRKTDLEKAIEEAKRKFITGD